MSDATDPPRAPTIAAQPAESDAGTIAPAPLQQSDNAELLTLKEIAERLGVTYGRLRGFADLPDVGPFVGAVTVPGVKGVRYAPEAEAQFARLIQAQDAGIITPKTARAYLANTTETALAPSQQSGNASDTAAIVPSSQSPNAAVVAVLERLTAIQERLGAALGDRLLTREQAAEMLACKPSAVGRYVRPVRHSVWRLSDVQRYIAGLSQR